MLSKQLIFKQGSVCWLLLAVILLSFALRLYRLDWQSLWWDEVKTIERGSVALPDMMVDLLAKRHHLPFYFVVMKIWLQIGQSAFIARTFSMFWGVISVALIYQLGRRAFNRQVGLLVAFLLAINPFHIWYSQEARMYMLLMSTIIAAHLFLLCLLRQDIWFYWVGYMLTMLTAVYTHLFALLIIVAHYIFFALHFRFLKPLFLKWLGYTAVVGALFAIWGVILLQTGGLKEATPPWIVGTSWSDLFLTLLAFSAGRTIDPAQAIYYLVPLVYLVGLLVIIFNRKQIALPERPVEPQQYQTFATRLLLIWLITPLLLTFFVSFSWPGRMRQVSLYTDRYLIIVLPALLVLATQGLIQLGQKMPHFLLLALGAIILGTIPGLYNNYFQPQYGREGWQEAVDYLAANALDTDLIWSQNDHQVPLNYYLDEQGLQVKGIVAAPPVGTEAEFEAGMQERLAIMEAQAERVWLVTQFYNNDIHGFPQFRNEAVQFTETADPQYEWLKTHLVTVKDATFVGIRLTLFDLSTLRPPLDS